LMLLIRRLDEMHNLADGRPHIHGVFYIHNINQNRMTQITKTNLRVIEELLGDHMLRNLVFVTNMWDSKPKARHIRLEEELIQNDEYFGKAIGLGAGAGAAYRICEDATPAEVQGALLDLFLDNSPEILQIQSELAERDDLVIAESGAGSVLREGLRAYVRGVRTELNNHEAQPGEVENLQNNLAMAEDQDFLLGASIGFLRRALAPRFVAMYLGTVLAGAAAVPVVGFGLAIGGTVALAIGGLVALYRALM
ncbi:hypothetical protein RSAG8_12933, partial [Rhizoctonia solani AG-8 WAC10335]